MENKIGLVTGAATGIGAEVCRQMAAAGATVAVCDINEQAGTALAREIGGTFIHCDVVDLASVKRAVETCVDLLGAPDYAHLNAGVMTVGANDPFLAIEDVSLDQYRRIMGVNVDGVFHGFKALLPVMREKGGAITVTASTAGLTLIPFDPLYATTKYAVIGLARSIAGANADTNIKVNVICPGMVDTGIVPAALRDTGATGMPVRVMAAEILDLLQNAPNGEVRVKSSADTPAFVMNVPDVNR